MTKINDKNVGKVKTLLDDYTECLEALKLMKDVKATGSLFILNDDEEPVECTINLDRPLVCLTIQAQIDGIKKQLESYKIEV